MRARSPFVEGVCLGMIPLDHGLGELAGNLWPGHHSPLRLSDWWLRPFQNLHGKATARPAGEFGRASLGRGAVTDLEEVVVQFVDALRDRPPLCPLREC